MINLEVVFVSRSTGIAQAENFAIRKPLCAVSRGTQRGFFFPKNRRIQVGQCKGGNLLLANLDLSSHRRGPRSTSAPVAWQVLRLGQPRELRRHFGGESEFKLDQTPAHEGAEVIAPHEFLVWRIEVFERLTAQAPP